MSVKRVFSKLMLNVSYTFAYRISGNFRVGLIFAEFATSLKSPKIDTAKNKPYYTSSLRVIEIAKIGLSENLTHLPSSIFAKLSRREKFPTYGSCQLTSHARITPSQSAITPYMSSPPKRNPPMTHKLPNDAEKVNFSTISPCRRSKSTTNSSQYMYISLFLYK